ncbi:MAG TPA: hypothetical protein VIG64_03095 [Actinomycetota bacterium]|jgi:hypothetical protein
MSELELDLFTPHVGTTFTLAGEAPLDLVLSEAIATRASEPQGHGVRPQFSLYFRGPRSPLLPQRIYGLEHPELGRLELFLVPVGQDRESTTYEAAFA